MSSVHFGAVVGRTSTLFFLIVSFIIVYPDVLSVHVYVIQQGESCWSGENLSLRLSPRNIS